MKNKLLVICGPTATGKTDLALVLAKKYRAEIISADSRQVYKKLDIGTGKDLPVGAKYKASRKHGGFYQVDGIKIWGYDLAGPKEEFSVAQYINFVRGLLERIWKDKKLPMLVGGTGLYIKGVVDGIATASIPKNPKLRVSLEKKPVSELFEMLSKIDSTKAANMNMSDRKNPRRLIRAIEVGIESSAKIKKLTDLKASILFIGLTAPRERIFQRIDERVKTRFKRGVDKEVRKLVKEGVGWERQSMTSLGYGIWRGYFERKTKIEEVLKAWSREEKEYAKRQFTWFKRDKRINWFDVTVLGWNEKVERLVQKWYSSDYDKKS